MSEDKKARVLAVVGPTASGKTALSIALAGQLGGEVVCCDSMQIYRDMTIGTAKPTAEEQNGIPHHMVDFLDACRGYSCAEYVRDARAAIEAVLARGAVPVLCGGTGLYLDGVLLGGSFEDTPSDAAVRERLREEVERLGSAVLYERLRQIDPESAAAIHPNNVKRVLRALEIYECCGVPKSELDRRSRERGLYYDATVIGLRYHSRQTLYERIDRRVELMLRQGLLDEVRMLEERGIFEQNATAAQAIGYKELLGVVRGTAAQREAVEQLKLATRHYAKRQMTWFSAKPYVSWIYADTPDGQMRPSGDVLQEALGLWTSVQDAEVKA